MHNKRKKISRHDAGKTAEQMVVGNGSTDMPFPLNTTSDPEQTVVDKTSTSAIGESFERESTVSSVNGTRPNQLLPCLDNDSILDKLGEHYRDKGLGAHAGRYYLGEEIGAGGGGRVFGVIDNDLGREIAAKFASIPAKNSRVAVKHFLKEAQTMASLAHPNVVPVYDIGISSNGEPFFTMKRVRGRTLGDVIRDACMKKPVPELATHNDIVNIFLKVCDAVAYANSKGVIHQDIKPDNIMLGEFGEVLLLDWGCSSSPNADKTVSRGITGTPAFMSPEQVRREGVTVRSDVYCIGGSLFHALTHRHPVSANTAEEFWKKKNLGQIDPLSDSEKATVPGALLEIALKALDPCPESRYLNATELASDLRKYQAGLAISWRPFAPVVFETDGNLRHDWIAYHCDNWGSEAAVTEDDRYCAWTICDNILKGANTGCFDNLTYRRKIRGNLRVEWRLLTRLGTENLNCYIAGENRKAGYLFHIGANGESRQILLTKGFDQIVMDLTWLPHSLEMNVWHDLVMEKENETLRLFIDGRQIICCQDPDMLDGRGHQTFGFETCNGNSYEIAGVKIFYQPLPQAISPVTVGDRFLEENYFEEAISQYEEIIESYPETGLAQRAQLKAARCKKALGDLDGAKKLLEGFVDAYPDSELVPYCMCDIARINIESYGPESIADVIDTLATKIPGHPLLRSLLFDISLYYQRHFRRVDPVQSKAFVESVSTRFGIPLTDNSYLRFLAHKYSEKKQFDQVLQDFPYLEIECADALINMGKPEKVLERYPAMRTKCAKALLQLGHPERVLQDYPELKEECAEALLRMDRPEDVLRLYPDLREKCALALLSLRRYEELLDKYRDRHWICGMALMKMGRLDDIAGYFPDDKGLKAFVLFQKRQYRETLEQHFGNYTTRTLLALCKPEEVVERYSNSERQDFVADALLALGREEEIPDRFPQCRGQCAAFFIRHGQFETVLDDYQDQPEMVIKALICKDMANEAIERYPSLRSDISLALNRLGHYDYLLANCPEQSGAIAEALIALGRAHEVMERFPAKQDECANALLSMGEFARVIQSYSILSDKGIRALIMMGRYDEAIERYPDSHHFMPEALIALGRIDELLDTQFAGRPHRIHALIIQGKQDTIFSRYRDLAGSCIMAHLSIGENETAVSRYERNPDVWRELLYCKYYEAVKTAISGDLAGAQEQLSSLTRNQIHFDNHYFLFPRFILPAFLRLLTGDIEGARQLLEDNSKKFPYQFAQRLRHYLEFLTGRIGNEEFGNQPCRRYIEPDTLLCSGLRAEFAGDETATGFYREYAALSAWKRELNPLLDIFVDWRIRAAEE